MSRSRSRSKGSKPHERRADTPRPPSRAKGRPLAWLALVVLLGAAGFYLLREQTTGSTPTMGFPPALGSGSAAGFNLVVVTLDTTRADHLGCYGRREARTPVLDGLAAGGVLFSDAVTVAPATLPTHASLFTGLYPPNHGVRKNGEYRLAAEHETLAETLQRSGYQTSAFIGAFVLDARFGLAQGFDVYDDAVTATTSLAITHTYNERRAEAVTNAALGWLGGRDPDSPFFLWLHYFDPHQPFDAPRSVARQFGSNQYDAEIAYVDSQLGRFLDALAAQDLTDETVVVVTADHGEGLGEHDESSHDFFIYESVMRVPLIVSCPGLVEGPYLVEEGVVSLVDIAPTLLDLLGVQGTTRWDGISLVDQRPADDRAIYMESLAPYLDYGWSPLFALRRRHDKYVRAPTPEYYDLRADPGELENLAADPSDAASGASRDLADALDDMLARWPSLRSTAERAQGVDPETRARLESLGYVGSVSPPGTDVEYDPKDMLVVFNQWDRARAHARGGRIQEALAGFEAVVAASPNNRAAYGEIAKLHSMAGNLPLAEQALRKSIALGPTPQALTLLAQVLIAGQRLHEAELLGRQALDLDPQHGMGYVILGDVAGQQDRFDEAEALYRQAAEVDPYRSGPAVEHRMQALNRRRGSPAR